MSRDRTRENVTENKNEAIRKIDDLLTELINSDDEKLLKRADLISYWIKSFCNFVKSEDTFDPKYLLKYKRGDVVKADFGYRCKNELGGLHYAIIIDVDNAKASGLVTVVPLSSKKVNKKIHRTEVDLGNEIFNTLISAYDRSLHKLKVNLANVTNNQSEISKMERDLDTLEKKKNEILKMKEGSVAMISHISTISKARIKDPVNRSTGILCDVKVSTTTLSEIDFKIAKMFTGMEIID